MVTSSFRPESPHIIGRLLSIRLGFHLFPIWRHLPHCGGTSKNEPQWPSVVLSSWAWCWCCSVRVFRPLITASILFLRCSAYLAHWSAREICLKAQLLPSREMLTPKLPTAAAIGPTGYMSQWRISPVPAVCLFFGTAFAGIVDTNSSYNSSQYWDLGPTEFNIPVTTLSLAFLLVGYITRVLRLFIPASNFASKWLRIIPGNCFKRLYFCVARRAKTKRTISLLGWSLIKAIMMLIYVLLKAAYEVHGSMLWEVSSGLP